MPERTSFGCVFKSLMTFFAVAAFAFILWGGIAAMVHVESQSGAIDANVVAPLATGGVFAIGMVVMSGQMWNLRTPTNESGQGAVYISLLSIAFMIGMVAVFWAGKDYLIFSVILGVLGALCIAGPIYFSFREWVPDNEQTEALKGSKERRRLIPTSTTFAKEWELNLSYTLPQKL